MPIFEFTCKACGHAFEELTQMGDTGEGLSCPECNHKGARKRLSLFSAHGLKVARDSSCGDCPLTDCTKCPSHAGAAF